MLKRKSLMLGVLWVLFSGVALAQGDGGAPEFDWRPVLTIVFNGVLVTLVVQAIQTFGPNLSGVVKQILALVGGALLMPIAAGLSSALGIQVDFGNIIGALNALAGATSGLVAMGVYDTTFRRMK